MDPLDDEFREDVNAISHSVEEVKLFQQEDIVLPEGTFIDLRFSGNLDSRSGTYSPLAYSTDPILLLFDEQGHPDRIFMGRDYQELINGSFSLLVRYYQDIEKRQPKENPLLLTQQILSEANSKWVTIGKNGDTFTKPNIPPESGDSIPALVREARKRTRSH